MTALTENEASCKICKIIGKKILRGGKVQINLHDGKNFLYGEGKVNDSVLVDLKKNKITKILPLKKGAFVFVISGKHTGEKGKVIEKTKDLIIIKNEKEIKTTISNIFVEK